MKRDSVLPNIAVTRTDEGVLFVADRVGWKDFAFMLFLVFGAVLNIYAYLLGQLDQMRQILSVLYAILALLTLVTIEQHYRQRKRMRGASLTVRPWPIRLGDEVKAVFRVAPAEWTFVIPDHLPSSLDVKCNRVIWRIVAMVTAGDAEVPVEFELLIIPEVAG